MSKRKFDWNEISSEEDSDQDDSKITIEESLKKIKKTPTLINEPNYKNESIKNSITKTENLKKLSLKNEKIDEIRANCKRENEFECSNSNKKIKTIKNESENNSEIEINNYKLENDVKINTKNCDEKLNLPKINLKLINSDYKKQGLNKKFNKFDKKEINSDFTKSNFKKKQLYLDKNQKIWFKEQIKQYEDDYDPNFCKKL